MGQMAKSLPSTGDDFNLHLFSLHFPPIAHSVEGAAALRQLTPPGRMSMLLVAASWNLALGVSQITAAVTQQRAPAPSMQRPPAIHSQPASPGNLPGFHSIRYCFAAFIACLELYSGTSVQQFGIILHGFV
jgi:hypothetical protein